MCVCVCNLRRCVFCPQAEIQLHCQNCLFVWDLSYLLQKTTTSCSWCIFVMPLCPCRSSSYSSFYQCLGEVPAYWHPLFLSLASSLRNLANKPEAIRIVTVLITNLYRLLSVTMGLRLVYTL